MSGAVIRSRRVDAALVNHGDGTQDPSLGIEFVANMAVSLRRSTSACGPQSDPTPILIAMLQFLPGREIRSAPMDETFVLRIRWSGVRIPPGAPRSCRTTTCCGVGGDGPLDLVLSSRLWLGRRRWRHATSI
jgi:hypothetical protein